jgi:hypothetical protein
MVGFYSRGKIVCAISGHCFGFRKLILHGPESNLRSVLYGVASRVETACDGSLGARVLELKLSLLAIRGEHITAEVEAAVRKLEQAAKERAA